jgi:hypothetical protein
MNRHERRRAARRPKEPHTAIQVVEDGGCPRVFVVVEGVRIAVRGEPGTPQAMTRVSLEPGWTVRDRDYPNGIEVECEGARVH